MLKRYEKNISLTLSASYIRTSKLHIICSSGVQIFKIIICYHEGHMISWHRRRDVEDVNYPPRLAAGKGKRDTCVKEIPLSFSMKKRRRGGGVSVDHHTVPLRVSQTLTVIYFMKKGVKVYICRFSFFPIYCYDFSHNDNKYISKCGILFLTA